MLGASPLFLLIPVTMVLTVSFFIMVVTRKLDSHPLRLFGFALVALLWFSAALILMFGPYVAGRGKCPMMQKMQMMKKMDRPCAGKQGQMMQQGTDAAVQPQK